MDDKQLHFQPSGSPPVVFSGRPQATPPHIQEVEEEGSGCVFFLIQVSSLNGFSGGEDKHQDASRLEPRLHSCVWVFPATSCLDSLDFLNLSQTSGL